MSEQRPPSWKAIGLVEKAWKRLTPPTQERLAELLGIKRTNLSKLNKGTMRMAPDYAQRISTAVLTDAPESGFTVADLGAPSSLVAESEPTVLDRLRDLETKYEIQRGALEAVEGVAERLEKRLVHLQTRLRQAERRVLGASP